MPTYSWRCAKCAEVIDMVLPMSEYIEHRPTLFHCSEPMGRYFPPTARPARYNATSESIYDGLRAPDGTDISTRAKHREYMRVNGLTTADDFKDTWAQAEQKRNEYRTTGRGGAVTREDIARALARQLDT